MCRRNRGSATGPSPVDRARNGSKHHLLVDATGIPLAWTVTGGNRNDVTQLVPLIERIPPVRGVVGRPPLSSQRARRRPRLRPRQAPPPRPRARHQTGHRAPPDRARLRAWPHPLGRRAHLRLAPQPQNDHSSATTAATRDPRSLPRPRLLPRLLQKAATVILRRLLIAFATMKTKPPRWQGLREKRMKGLEPSTFCMASAVGVTGPRARTRRVAIAFGLRRGRQSSAVAPGPSLSRNHPRRSGGAVRTSTP